MRIAVTSGYRKSLHAAGLIAALHRRGHAVPLCLNVRMLNRGRLIYYVRQIGWRKLLSRFRQRSAADAGSPEIAPMLAWLAESGITTRSVADACRDAGTKLLDVADLNSPAALEALRAEKIDAVVYAGGGLLRKAFLEIPPRGVLNAHGGPLPRFRGMNAAEWSVLHGVAPVVTITQVDAGVDTGPILLERPIPLDKCATVAAMRGWGTRVGVEALLETVDLLQSGELTPRLQQKEDGRQYFVMAAPLLELVERKLAARNLY